MKRSVDSARSCASPKRPRLGIDQPSSSAAAYAHLDREEDAFVAQLDGWEEDDRDVIVLDSDSEPEGDVQREDGVRSPIVVKVEKVDYRYPDPMLATPSLALRPVQRGGAFGFDTSDEEDVDPDDVVDLLQDLYDVVDERVKYVRKFGYNGYRTKFILKDDARIDQPVEVLGQIIQRFIDQALRNSRVAGYSTEWIGLTFCTEEMSQGKGQWLIPFRPPAENNAAKVLQEMENFDQSENSPPLFGNMITMKVTTIRAPQGGAWDAMNRRVAKAQIRRRKNPDWLVPIENTDNICLFRCIRVGMFYHDNGGGEWKRALRYTGDSMLTYEAMMLLIKSKCPAPKRKPLYGLEDLKLVDAYLQQKYPDRYRFLVFSDNSHTETVYNSGVNAQFTITLYHHNGHFDLVKSPQKFFGCRQYCVDCEKTFDNIADHSKDCQIRCYNCFRMGAGYPCQPRNGQWDITLECPDCRRFFATQECMDNHKPHSCNTFKRCTTCDCVYRHNNVSKNGGHRCDEKFCGLCKQYHSRKYGCYIRQVDAPKVQHHRIVGLDFESQIHGRKQKPAASVVLSGDEAAGEGGPQDLQKKKKQKTKRQKRAVARFLDLEAEESGSEDEEPQDASEDDCGSVSADSEPGAPEDAVESDEPMTNPKRTDHSVNYVAAFVTCDQCIASDVWEDFENDSCEVCGPFKSFKCGEWELQEGGDVVEELLNFLLNELPADYPTYAYAHNGGKYDNHFLLQALYNRRGVEPKITSNGHKLFQVHVRKTRHNNELFLRDSCLLFPMKLEDAPEAFDLHRSGKKIDPKMYFPYLYNKAEDYFTPIDGLPPVEDYLPSKFTEKEKAKFLEWYGAEVQQRLAQDLKFDLRDALEEYCTHDALILMYALVTFRAIYNEQAGCDMFFKNCTVTSGCLRLFKKKYLKEKQLAIVPNHGYGRFDRQSAKALKYLKWFAWAHNVEVQHRDSEGGEHQVGAWYKLDGYIAAGARQSPGFQRCNVAGCPYCVEAPTGQVALEFNGCAYHGCAFGCFKNDVRLPTGKKSDEQRIATELRADHLGRLGYFVMPVQECQLDKELKTNETMQFFFESSFDTGHIDPRDGFFGGRVGPMRMHCVPAEDEEIKFFDIVSLYPYVLRNMEFPIGHPSVKRKFDEYYWTKDDWDRKYSQFKGVFKVVVLPPTDLTIPVLPLRDSNRLLFPLCRSCSVESRKVSPYRGPGCTHNKLERAYTITTTHVELDLAFKAGYQVLRAVEVWHYHEWANDVFEGYITDFVQLKEEATGWESIGEIEDDGEREKAMDAFIDAYEANTKGAHDEGIRLRKDFVKKNPALRAVMKIFLNSLWGRLAMRPNKSQVEIIRKPSRLYELLGSTTKVVESIVELNDELLRVSWKYKDRCDREDQNSNVVVALFTTSYGRAELYKHMCKVEESMGGKKGSRFLYGDTDSMTFVQKKADPAMTSGRHLGDMKDEYPKHEILEFCCGGNKQYALKLRELKSGEISYKMKIRGITLNSVTSAMLTYEKMREMVLSQKAEKCAPIRLPCATIRRDHHSNVFTWSSDKAYCPIFMKGWIDCDLRIWPHGYVPEEERQQTIATAMSYDNHLLMARFDDDVKKLVYL